MKGGKTHFGLWSNTISNEYDYSPSLINFHVDSNHYLTHNKDDNGDGLNNAEREALNAEREREDTKRKQKEEYEINMTQYRKNNSQYRLKKEEGQSLVKIQHLENEKKKLNQMVYNASIRKANLKKMVDKKCREQNVEEKLNDDSKLQPKKEEEQMKNKSENSDKTKAKTNENDGERIMKANQPNQHQENINQMSDTNAEPNSITVDIRTAVNDIVRKTLQSQKNKRIKSILEEEKNAYQEISSKLKQLSNFREKGTINSAQSTNTGQSKQREREVFTQRTQSGTKPNNHTQANDPKQRQSKLDKRRFNIALKKIFIEKLGERNIKVPSICNCGQLQKNLDTILYVKNNSVYSVFKPTCANNCLYYNNRHEYEKSIEDILVSIRSLKFDSFNNKY